MSAHTKGPWAIRVGYSFEDGGTGYYELQGAPWKPSGDGARFAILDSVSEADVRLIVAAPELLAKVEHLTEELAHLPLAGEATRARRARIIRDAQKLIAKSTGEA